MFLEISQNSQESARVSFPATLLKRDSNTGVFPVNFTKFLRTPFHRTPLSNCFLKKLTHFMEMYRKAY